MKLWIAFLSFLLITISSFSVKSYDTGTVIGEGARTCKKMAKASGRKENNFIIWVQGYFSAYNAIAPDIQNIAQDREFRWILDKLKNYCKAHPEEYFNDAVQALVLELHPKGIRVSDKPTVGIKLE